MIGTLRVAASAYRVFLICLVSVMSVSCMGQYDPPEQDPLTLALPIPDGHCAMSRANSVEDGLYVAYHNIYRGRGWLASMFADCEELAAFRDGGMRPSRFGSYTFAHYGTALPSWYVGQPADLSRSRAVAILTAEYRHTDPTQPRVTSTEDFMRWNARRDFGLQRLRYLGVLRSDETAVFFGVLEHVRHGDYTLATVTGVTSIGGNLVNIDLSAPFQGEETIEILLDQQQRNIRALIAANP